MNVLIIDLGSKYLKLSVFQDTKPKPSLLYFSVKDVTDKNTNIYSRILARELTQLKQSVSFDKTYVLPKRSHLNNIVTVIEYNSEKIMTQSILNIINEQATSEGISDWTIQQDSPDEDFQNVFISTLSLDEYKSMSEILKINKLSNSILTNPIAYLPTIVPNNDKAYLVMDVGYSGTTFAIVKNTNVLKTSYNSSISSGFLMSEVSKSESYTKEELGRKINNITYVELSLSGCQTVCLTLANEAKNILDDWKAQSSQTVAGYFLTGGLANLDIDTSNVFQELNCPRIYPRLNLLNDELIPSKIRPYLYEPTYLLSVIPDLNFATPKDKNIGRYIKATRTVLNGLKYPLALALILGVSTTASNAIGNYLLGKHIQQQQQLYDNFNSQVTALQSNISALQSQYDELLNDTFKIVNYGELLKTIGQLTPKNTFIVQMTDVTSNYTASLANMQSQEQMQTPQDTSVQSDTSTQNMQGTLDLSGSSSPSADTSSMPTSSNVLVCIELDGYTLRREEALDFAISLGSVYQNVKVLSVESGGSDAYFNFKIQFEVI